MKVLGTFTQSSDQGVDAILCILEAENGDLVFQTQVIRGVSGTIRVAADDAPLALAAIQKLSPVQAAGT